MPDLPPLDFAGFEEFHFTPVPDLVFDELMPRLSEAEFKVLCYIIRRTKGFKKDADAISRQQLVKGITRRDGTPLDHGTGMSDSSVGRGIKGLLEKGIILAEHRQSATAGDEATVYRLRMRRTGVLHSDRGGGINLTEAPLSEQSTQETPVQDTEYKNGSGRNLVNERAALKAALKARGRDVPAGLAAWDAAGQPPYTDWLLAQ
jgi:hypothetical protein